MKEEQIQIDGTNHKFSNNAGKIELVLDSRSTHKSLIDPHENAVPDVWVITRANGDILFTLRGDEGDGVRYCTAQTLYDKYKTQWFEPLADNYRELLWVNKEEYIRGAYKWFTWEEIKDFACVDRIALSYARSFPGDWKEVSEGADGFLLVMVDEYPYWGDAVGQIPYAVDTYRAYVSAETVVELGMIFGKGYPSFPDRTNEYDNYFVLRGALFAKKMYRYELRPASFSLKTAQRKEIVTDVAATELGNPITSEEVTKYGTWNR